MRSVLARLFFAISVASLALPALAFTAAAQEAPKILDARPVQVLFDQAGRYVAGKATAVVVVLDTAIASDAATQKVVVKRAGSDVATLAPLPQTETRRTLEFSCASLAECGGWKAGDYTFGVTVGATTLTTPAFSFKDRSVMNILAMPLKQNYGTGDVRAVVDESWKKAFDFARRTFPLIPDSVKVTFGPELDLSADTFNIKTSEGMDKVAEALTALQPAACTTPPVPADVTCYKKVMGFVKDRHGPGGTLQGYAAGIANVVTATDEDVEATVAHEIAHGYELGDEYQGGSFHCKNNPTPPDYVGKDWFDRTNKTFSCAGSPRKGYPFGGTGTLIEPIFDGTNLILTNEGPYEIGGRRFLTPMVSFMGAGGKQNQNWITKDAWARLFDSYDPAAAVAASAVDPQAATTRYVRFVGEIDPQDRVDLRPWTSFTSTKAAKDTTGDLFVRAVNASGTTLATSKVTIELDHPEGIPNWSFKDFEGAIAYPTGTSKFELVKGSKVLATVAATANAPAVTITSPKAGDKPTGETKVTWTATDADGGKLFTTLEYSADNGKSWLPFEADIEGTSLTVDWNDVGGTGKAESLIRVTVSDGVNATSASSGAFTVTAKAPLAEIHFPEAYHEVQKGAAVFLYGEGLDLLDDVITSAIIWTSDRDGPLGTGDLIETTKLSQGTHVITMTVTNSIGLKSTATVTVVVHVAGRKAAAADVYNVYHLYLGRDPQYPIEVVGWVGQDFGFLVEEVRESLEALLWLDSGHAIEAKSPFTGLRIQR